MNLLKGAIKWILLGALFILIIFLLVNIGTKKDANPQKNNDYEPGVNIIEPGLDDEEEEQLEEIQEDLTVDSPDTASDSFPQVVIGIFILTYGIQYIRKHRVVRRNS